MKKLVVKAGKYQYQKIDGFWIPPPASLRELALLNELARKVVREAERKSR